MEENVCCHYMLGNLVYMSQAVYKPADVFHELLWLSAMNQMTCILYHMNFCYGKVRGQCSLLLLTEVPGTVSTTGKFITSTGTYIP